MNDRKSDITYLRDRGKVAEKLAKSDYKNHGYKIIPTTIGSDFIAVKKFDGKLFKEFVEVKSGSSRLSRIQKKKRIEVKRTGHTYTIYRVSDLFLSAYLDTNERRKK